MKLAGALAMPLFALAIVTGLEVAQTTRDVDEIRSQTNLARASTGHAGLITTLQDERTWAAVELIGQEGSVGLSAQGYPTTRANTDAAITTFRNELASKDEAIRQAYQPALDALSELETLRADIDAIPEPHDTSAIDPANDIYARYSALIRPFLDANSRVALAIDDPDLRKGTTLVDLSSRQVEQLADLARTTIVGMTLGGGIDEASEIAEVSKQRSAFDQTNRDILATGEPYAELIEDVYPAELVSRLSEQLDLVIGSGTGDFAAMLEAVNVPPEAGYMGMRGQAADALNDRADELNRAAEARQRWYIALAVATLGAAVIMTWLVSRSITKPLRALTRQATTMADHRLPEAVIDILDTPLGEDVEVPEVDPVAVPTRDEVSDVAEALNTVQDTALDLAVEQAVLRRNIADSFVNLGRRNQNLLGRQLDFITELESHETNPDTLANLFRLDHLATRMRRNAESLLVLAGIDPPRKWASPVRLTDVIRAALGEVEDYQRVSVRGVEPATIVGSAAADLAHLLAELIENALVFSPPDQTVVIRGRFRPGAGPLPTAVAALPSGAEPRRSASAGADRPDVYTLAIIDSGLGMTPANVEAANRRLAGAESFTIAPSKYLGHYVAGNLAARHDIGVRLDNSPGNGVTATVNIPPTLLSSDVVTSAPVTPPEGMRPVGARANGATRRLAPAAPSLSPGPAGAPEVASPWGDPAPASPPLGTPRVGGQIVHARTSFGPATDPRGVPSAAPRASSGVGPPSPHGPRPGGTHDAPAPGAADQPSPAWLTEQPPATDTRTSSGLVKRAPRDAADADAVAGTHPTGDLLAALSRLAGDRTGEHPPVLPGEAPSGAPAAGSWSSGEAPSGSWPPFAAAPGAAPGSAPSVPPQSGPAPSAPAPPGPEPSGPEPSGPPPPFVAAPGPAPAPPEVPPPPADAWGSSPVDTPLAPRGPGSIPPPQPLARRTRGAQMPSTEPLAVRRTGREAASTPGSAVQPPPEVRRTANDVYSLLTSFTAGVRRGLDEAKAPPSHHRDN